VDEISILDDIIMIEKTKINEKSKWDPWILNICVIPKKPTKGWGTIYKSEAGSFAPPPSIFKISLSIIYPTKFMIVN